MALSYAVTRDPINKVVKQEDLIKAADHQLRGRLAKDNGLDRKIVPTHGIDSVILAKDVKEKLNEIIQYSKASLILFGQWGFEKHHGSSRGISALFTGEPGTGE